MNATKQALWLFIFLISLASSAWYYASFSIKLPKLDASTLSITPDATIKQLKIKQFGDNGQLVNSLETPYMQHIPAENTHKLKTPQIQITQDNQPAWKINAEEATSLHGGETIIFRNHVIVHQHDQKTNQMTQLRTEELIYYPKQKKATTKRDVIFEQPGIQVQSTGMIAYLEEKRVKLLSNARGTYAPKG